MGDVKPWLWGKNPCVATLLNCHPFFLIQPLPTSLMFCWVAEELWLLVVGAVMVFGSGVAGLSVPFPHAHSTHDFPFTPLHPGQFTFTATSVEARAEPWSVHLPHAEVGVVFPHALVGSSSRIESCSLSRRDAWAVDLVFILTVVVCGSFPFT